MKILIIGNIGSGKTTLAKGLSGKLGIKHVSIDDLRKKHGDGSVPGEYQAIYHFLKSCSESENAILEFSGAGCHKYAVKKALDDSEDKIIVILVDNDLDGNLERIKEREWDIPFPWQTDLKKHVKFIEEELVKDYTEHFWGNNSDSFHFLVLNNKNGHLIEELVESVMEKVKKLD